jgi:glycosyltransferase involved in cell wall biosynthesis
MKVMKIGVIIPAYNEANAIGAVLDSLPRTLTLDQKYTVIPVVIDDGSTDETAKVAESHPAKPVVIRHILNMGAGAATRTGLQYLKKHGYAFGATVDADGQHVKKDIANVITAAVEGKGDIVIGSRLGDPKGMPWYKIMGNIGLNFVTRLLLGVSTTDSQSGLKGFNSRTINALDFRENGYAFCSEMLWRAQRADLSITEVHIQAVYTDYSKGKGQNSWNGFNIIKQLIKHRLADLLHE